MKRPIDRYLDGLARRRRPRPFAPSEDDLAVVRTAIDLAAAGPDGRQPRTEFVEELRRRLAAQEATTESAGDAPQPWSPARRRILTATALTATATAGAVADHVLTGPASEPPASAESELTPTTGAWQTVAADADLPEGAVLSFDVGAVTGFLQRVSGRIQAVSGICTHQGCRLDLDAPRGELTCPCHGATFTATGQPLTHPHNNHALPPLPRLPVRVDQGRIQIYAPSPTPAAGPAA